MNSFKCKYHEDLIRYNGDVDAYIHIWLYLYRKCCYCKTPIIIILYKVAFRLWSNRKGLEISTTNPMGGGLYIGHAYNITINQNARMVAIVTYIKE